MFIVVANFHNNFICIFHLCRCMYNFFGFQNFSASVFLHFLYTVSTPFRQLIDYLVGNFAVMFRYPVVDSRRRTTIL